MTSKKADCWDSEMKFLKKVDVIIPQKILKVCDKIASKMNGNEFSIICNIENQKGDKIYLKDTYYIPLQEVSSASVDYKPDDNIRGDVVIHRHPRGCNGFSPTDNEYINKNYKLSILYTREDKFITGVFNLKHKEFVIPIEVNCLVEEEPIEIENFENIQERKFETVMIPDRADDFEMEILRRNKKRAAARGTIFEDEITDIPNIHEPKGSSNIDDVDVEGYMEEFQYKLQELEWRLDSAENLLDRVVPNF
ncbi:MAG: hypothetical protein NTU73_09980 [Ignavibacteriae bacterium]|nr:hypothetical protein [Ignavibacteriota bacterium]